MERFIGAPVVCDDVVDHCVTVGTLRADATTTHGGGIYRPSFPGAVAALFAGHFGVLEGMLLASQFFFILLLAGLYIWGVALAGRSAGVLAVLLACLVGPLVLATRSLTFYPAIAALNLLGAALVCLAARLGTVRGILLGAVGCGLTLLGDQMAIVWAAPGLSLLLVLALRPLADRRPRPMLAAKGLLALLLPLLCSWAVAASLPPVTFPLQLNSPAQVNIIKTLEVRAAQNLNAHLHEAAPHKNGSFPGLINEQLKALGQTEVNLAAWQQGFIWGHSSPLGWLHTPGRLVALSLIRVDLIKNRGRNSNTLPWFMRNNVVPWLIIGGAALLLCLVYLRRNRPLLLAMFFCLIPYALFLLMHQQMTSLPPINLHQIPGMGEGADSVIPVLYRPKYLTIALAPVPLLLAVAIVALARLFKGRAARAVVTSVSVLAVAALLLGWSSPAGPGMRYLHEPENLYKMLARLAESSAQRGDEEIGGVCMKYLRNDQNAGLPVTRPQSLELGQ